MKPSLLIVTDPFGKPAYAPRLRYFANFLVRQGWNIEVYTEQFEPHSFTHTYPIIEFPCFKNKFDWMIKSVWALLTDWRNRHFSQMLRKSIEGKHFDMVFCTTFSTFPLRAAKDIATQRHIPLHIDLRDVDEQVPDAQYQAHRQWWAKPFRNWYRAVNIHRRNRVLRQATSITTISPWHVDFLRQFNPNVHLIYNGFDPNQFYFEAKKEDSFLITYIGRIYEFQHKELIEQIIHDLQLPDIQLNWHTPQHNPIAITEVGDEIRRSSIVLVLTSPTAKGMMTTKFYEGLGCEKPILCTPSDKGCLAQVIQEANAGIASGDVDKIKAFLLDKYHEWQKNGYTHQVMQGKEKFSREQESAQLESILLTTKQPPLLVDVCWTLYSSNTTFDFLDSIVHDTSYLKLRRYMKLNWIRWTNLGILKLTHFDPIRYLALRHIKSYTQQQLDDLAQEFVTKKLDNKKIAATWPLLAGREVVIVSGTLACIAKAVARQIGGQVGLANDIYKRDAKKLFPNYDILTDNTADLQLVNSAHHATIVCYNNRSWWEQHIHTHCSFIEVDEYRY